MGDRKFPAAAIGTGTARSLDAVIIESREPSAGTLPTLGARLSGAGTASLSGAGTASLSVAGTASRGRAHGRRCGGRRVQRRQRLSAAEPHGQGAAARDASRDRPVREGDAGARVPPMVARRAVLEPVGLR